ncbi:MAG: endonuclease/exonuclease/phosphatase family protein [Anaerolineae bacterium]|nr:endonuclease/exonuclease/phosphatase family protein [Anaerolineae bacterium]
MNERRWGVVTAVYLALMAMWFGLWWLTADRFWWLVMVNRVVPYLFVPALVLPVIFLVKRRWRLAVMAGLPLLIFVWLYWPYLLPQRSEPGTAVLRVMSYNVLFSNHDVDGVARVIKTYAPDLVALQEVQPRMMAQLQERLAAEYPYALMGTPNDFGTTTVFSRYPFLDQQIVDLGDDRPATMVAVAVGGERVVFTAVHLRAYGLRWVPLRQMPQAIGERTRLQNRQAEILMAALAQQEGTVIVGCDCNSKESSSSYRMLTEMLANAAHSHPSLILPGASPDRNLQHIDYILYRGNVRANGVYVIVDSGGSDHQPIMAIFIMAQTQE